MPSSDKEETSDTVAIGDEGVDVAQPASELARMDQMNWTLLAFPPNLAMSARI